MKIHSQFPEQLYWHTKEQRNILRYYWLTKMMLVCLP